MFSGGASALLLVLSVLAALTPGAWASPEEHVEEYYGADAARSAPAASPPKEVSAAVAAYNRLQLPASDPLHPNYFEHIPKDGFTDWKDLRSFVEFGAWGIKEMCEELDRWKPYTPPHLQPLPLPPTPLPYRWKDGMWETLLEDFRSGFLSLDPISPICQSPFFPYLTLKFSF